jgi:hypothetical protein
MQLPHKSKANQQMLSSGIYPIKDIDDWLNLNISKVFEIY